MLIIHDIYPDIAINMGYIPDNSIIALAWRKLNQKIYQAASFIIVLGRDAKMRILNQLPAEQHPKVNIIANWADPNLISPLDHRHNPFIQEIGLNNKFIACL